MPNNCPPGFSCQKTRDNKDVCCTIKDPKESETKESTTISTTEATESTSESLPQPEMQREIINQNNFGEIKQKTKSIQQPSSNHKPHINCRPNEQLRNGVCV